MWRATSPRCHFHIIVSRSFGSITVKYGSRKSVMNCSFEVNSSPRHCSCFHHSVENPITAQTCACRFIPSTTSAFDL